MDLLTAASGLAFLATAGWIARRQRRAPHCRHHDPRVGAVAVALAAACALAGAALLLTGIGAT